MSRPAHDVDEQIADALRDVIDPELGINIVDLGLVYASGMLPTGDIVVEMTMTTPLCPLSAHLTNEVKAALRNRFPSNGDVKVQLVWDTPWDPSMMSQAARSQMGWGR